MARPSHTLPRVTLSEQKGPVGRAGRAKERALWRAPWVARIKTMSTGTTYCTEASSRQPWSQPRPSN